jgi:hypothetical protein
VLAGTARSSSPDVVPHGPATHVASWSPLETASSAAGAATPVVPAYGDAPAGAVGRVEAPRNHEPGEDPRGGDGRTASLSGKPEVAAESDTAGDRPPAIHDPGSRREDFDDRIGDLTQEAAGATPSVEPLGPHDAPESPMRARRPAWAVDLGDPGQVRTPASVAPIGSIDPVSPAPPPIAWPDLPPPENGTRQAHPGEPWPPPVARSPRVPAVSMPDSPATERARATFEPLLAPTRREATPRDLGGWRVRAAAPDTSTVARLALPPWPDLPEPPADDGDPDWRAIERRLQRAARLDREQRRR